MDDFKSKFKALAELAFEPSIPVIWVGTSQGIFIGTVDDADEETFSVITKAAFLLGGAILPSPRVVLSYAHIAWLSYESA